MLVYIVIKKQRGKEVEAVYVFDNHADALRCRKELGLTSDLLWGTTVNCYNAPVTSSAF